MYTFRKHQRTALFADVSIESENVLYTGISNDISAGGIFIATHVPPRREEIVEVTLKLPDAQLSLIGVVRWVRDSELASDGLPAGCGVEWLEMSADAMERIAGFAAATDTLYAFADECGAGADADAGAAFADGAFAADADAMFDYKAAA